jgi:hypothetical protein
MICRGPLRRHSLLVSHLIEDSSFIISLLNLFLTLGNLEQLFSPEGIPWHHAMSKKFGGVFKVYGLFGVRITLLSPHLSFDANGENYRMSEFISPTRKPSSRFSVKTRPVMTRRHYTSRTHVSLKVDSHRSNAY